VRTALLALIFAALPTAAIADPASTWAGAFTVTTAIDAVQTQTFLHGGSFPCSAIGPSLFQPAPPLNATCHAIEADPLARPFVGTWAKQIGSALVADAAVWTVTGLLRGGARRTWARILGPVVVVYAGGVLVPNQRIIQAQRNP